MIALGLDQSGSPFLTNSVYPVISGTVESRFAGYVVDIFNLNNPVVDPSLPSEQQYAYIGFAVVGANGKFKYEFKVMVYQNGRYVIDTDASTSLYPDGLFNIGFTLTSPDGTDYRAADPLLIQVDTTTTAPVVYSLDTDPASLSDGAASVNGMVYTKYSTPVLRGYAESGATVTILDGTLSLGTAVATGSSPVVSGNTLSGQSLFTFTVPLGSALGQGPHTLNVSATDRAGNISATTSQTIGVDSVTPAPTVLLANAISFGGVDYTKNNKPTLNGVAEPGANMAFIDQSGNTLGNVTAHATTGVYSFTPTTPLADGAKTITARATDALGNTASTTRNVTIDTQIAAPTLSIAAPALTVGGVTYDRINTPTITGTAEVGSTVTISDGPSLLGSAEAGVNGIYSFTTPVSKSLSDGVHTLNVTATDVAGNVSTVVSKSITIDALPPAPPSVTLASPALTSGGVLYDRDNTPSISGTAEAGSTVTIKDGTSLLGTADAGLNGNYSFTTPDLKFLSDGPHTLNVTATDVAGNVSSVNSQSVTIDTTPPTIASISSVSNNPIQTLAKAGNTITASFTSTDPVTAATMGGKTATVTNVSGNSYTATYVVQANDTGATAVSVTSTDTAGNTTTQTSASAVTMDTTPPTVVIGSEVSNNSIPTLAKPGNTITASFTSTDPVTAATIGGKTATVINVSGNSYTATYVVQANDTGATAVSVTSTDAAGNATTQTSASAVTMDTTPPTVVMGSEVSNNPIPTLAKAGNTITASFTSTDPVTAATIGGKTATVTNVSGNSYTATYVVQVGDSGATGVSVISTDAAGNVTSQTLASAVTMDTTVTAPTLALATDSGAAGDGITNVGTVNVVGLESGATWQYQIDGGGFVNGTGTSYTATAGSHSYAVKQTDAAGNVSSPSAGVTYNLDIVSPTVGSVAITGASGKQNNRLNADDVVSVTVTMNEATTVTGTPQLALVIGATTVQANYVSGSNTTGLVFSYTIVANQTDANGISLAANALGLNAGTLNDVAGNAAVLTTAAVLDNASFLVDTTVAAPTLALATDSGTPGDGITNVATVNVVGLEIGATWQYQVDGGGFVNGTGTSLTATAGSHSYAVKQTDAAGNVSSASAGVTYNLDTVAPTTPAISIVAGDDIINASEAGGVISGTTEAGSTVSLSIGGVTRTPTVTGTTWSYTLVAADITNMGQGAKTLTVTSTDAAGNTSSATRNITVDTVAPTTPVINLVAGNDIINASEAGSVISGTTEALSTVSLSIGGVTRSPTVTGNAWSYTLVAADITNMGQGPETLTVTVTDAAGNTSSATRAITVDTVAPPTPVVNMVAGDDGVNLAEASAGFTITGSGEVGATVVSSFSSGRTLVGGSSVVVGASGTWSLAVTAADVTAFGQGAETITINQTDVAGNANAAAGTRAITVDTTAPTTPVINTVAGDDTVNASEAGGVITGTTEAGSTVSLSIGGVTRTPTVNGTTWSYTLLPADITSMGQGPETLTVTATDAAGNTSSATRNITVDTVAPTTPVISLVAGDDTVNASEAGGVISGATEAGSTVSLSIGGVTRATIVTGTAWSYTLLPADITNMGQGSETLTVTATDAAGNTSSATRNITVDTVAPTVGSVAITGASGKQNNTLNADDVVSVSVTMNEATTVTGTPQLALNIGGTPVQANYASGSGSNTLVFSYTILAGQTDANGISLAANALSLNAGTLKDAAGNGATLSTGLVADNQSYLVDTTPPTVVMGSEVSSNATTTLAKAGDTITVLFTSTDPVTAATIGGKTATVTHGSGDNYTATYLVQAGDTGATGVSVTSTDAAGNATTQQLASAVTFDTSAPSAPASLTATDDVGTVTGPIAAGGKSNDTLPAFSGTAEPGSTVTIKDGTTVLGTVNANATTGVWSFTPSTALGEGSLSITATARDVAGNTGAASSALAFTIDMQAPTAIITLSDTALKFGETSTVTFTFSEAVAGFSNSDVTLSNGLLSALVSGDGGITWTGIFTPTNNLKNDSNAITLASSYTDMAGNGGTTANSENYSIDTQPHASVDVNNLNNTYGTLMMSGIQVVIFDNARVLVVGAGGYASLTDASKAAQSGDVIYVTDSTLASGANGVISHSDISIYIVKGDGATMTLSAAGEVRVYGDHSFNLTGSSGNDTLHDYTHIAAGLTNTLSGGDGNDSIVAHNNSLGSKVLKGDGGNDTLVGGANAQLLGGDGSDTLLAWGGAADLFGDAGNDVLLNAYASTDNAAKAVTLLGGTGYDVFGLIGTRDASATGAMKTIVGDLETGDAIDLSFLEKTGALSDTSITSTRDLSGGKITMTTAGTNLNLSSFVATSSQDNTGVNDVNSLVTGGTMDVPNATPTKVAIAILAGMDAEPSIDFNSTFGYLTDTYIHYLH